MSSESLPDRYKWQNMVEKGNTKQETAVLFVNRYPAISPPMPSGAEYKGFIQEKPKRKPETHPYTGPLHFENHNVKNDANIIPKSIPGNEIVLSEGIMHTQTEYMDIR